MKKKQEKVDVLIDIYDTKGIASQLPEGVGVGKGSKGRISGGKVSLWEAGTKRKPEHGITLFLSSIQISDFIPYEFDATPEEVEGSFKGFNQPKLESKEEDNPQDSQTTRRPRRSRRTETSSEDDQPTRRPRRSRG